MRTAVTAIAAMLATTPAMARQTSPAAPVAAPAALAPAAQARVDALPTLLGGGGRYDEAFAPAFRDKVPEAQWRTVLDQIAATAGKPVKVERIVPASPWSASVEVRFERAVMGMRIVVAPDAPHPIIGLLVTGPVAAEASVPAVLDALAALPGGGASVTVARLGDGAPVPLHQVGGGRALAIGSEFKLVILAEAIRAVAAGERHWDDPVTLDGAPLPGGGYTHKPAGTKVPLRELAQAMIAISDNSATDLMIRALGRERIEAMLPVVGIARPAGMRPFLTTLEAFKLKASIAGGDTAWLAADEVGRRRLLAGPVAAMPLAGIDKAFAAGRPLSIDRVEWFASPDDLVRVLDWIRRHTDSGPAAEARAILARNPGVGPAAARGWRYVGYKGGSEPGVIAMSVLLQAPAGHWYAVSAGWNDAARPVDDARFASLVTRLVELLRAQA